MLSIDEAILDALDGQEAYAVGGAVRDELLGRPVLDLDVACRHPQEAARAYRARRGGAVFLLSERHGAWRVALPDGRTVDFTVLQGTIDDDLAGRDFTVNAIAVPVDGGEAIDPFRGHPDLDAGVLRAVSDQVFRADPLRLLRAVRLEQELDLQIDDHTEALLRRDANLVTTPAGERIWGELSRMGVHGWQRLEQLGLLGLLGGSTARLPLLDPGAPHEVEEVAVFGEALLDLPTPRGLRRLARALLGARPPQDGSPREIHRFRRATEPWSLEALWFLGRLDLAGELDDARHREPTEPLVRGDELGLPPGPERGRILERIAEERAAGTISTREEALALVQEMVLS